MHHHAIGRFQPRAGIAAITFSLLCACGGSGETPPPAADTSRQTASQSSPGLPLAPLTVTGSVPGDSGNNASRDLQPAFIFSSLLRAASLSPDNFALFGADGPATPASIEVIDRVARLRPTARLLPQTRYTVRAEPGIQDQSGQSLVEPVQRSFTTADASWQALAPVPDGGFIARSQPAVAIDAKGNAWVAWAAGWPGNTSLYVSRFDALQGSWGQPMWMAGGKLCDVDEPQVAVDGSGNVVLVWRMRLSSKPNQVWVKRRSALTGTWDNGRILSNDEGSSNNHHDAMPRLAVRASGEVAVAWRRTSTEAVGMTGVYLAAGSATGGAWTAPTRIDNPDSTLDDGVASLVVALAPEPGRRLAVVWATEATSSNPMTVWASVFQSHAAWPWTPPNRLSSTETHQALDADITVDGAGAVYATWRDQGPSVPGAAYNRLWYARHDGSGWQGPRLITGANDQATGAHIASSSNPGQDATWVTWFDQGRRVMATRLRAGGPDTPRLIGNSPDPLNANQFSRHVVDPAGNVLAAWTTGSGTNASVMAARYVAGLGAWQTVRQLDQRTLDFPYTVALSISATGDAVAAWHGLVRDAWGVTVQTPLFARHFD